MVPPLAKLSGVLPASASKNKTMAATSPSTNRRDTRHGVRTSARQEPPLDETDKDIFLKKKAI